MKSNGTIDQNCYQNLLKLFSERKFPKRFTDCCYIKAVKLLAVFGVLPVF